MLSLSLITFVVTAAVYVTYIAGVWFVFRGHGLNSDPLGLRLLKGGALATKIAVLWAIWEGRSVEQADGWWYASLGLFAVSFALFWWAAATIKRRPLTLAFSPDRPEHLVDYGPYRYVRHPFYTSYLIGYAAGLVATRRWELVPFIAGMTGIYWWAASTEERKFASGSLAAQYAAYRARTFRFFPRFFASPETGASTLTRDDGVAQPRRRAE